MNAYRRKTTYHKRKTQQAAVEGPSHWWLALSAILFAAGLVFLALFAGTWLSYRHSDAYYKELRTAALPQGVQQTTETAAATQVDFAALQAINPDAAAWLEMPGLGVSLPVVQAQDDQTYLHKGFSGESDPNGCLFIAAPQEGQTTDLYRVIYGHNIHTGAMFGQLTKYADENFYRKNPSFTLCTPQGDKTCRIFSCHAAVDGEDLYETAREPGEAYDAFLQQLKAASLYDTGVAVPGGSQVITLSTCSTSYGGGTERFVVHAIIDP